VFGKKSELKLVSHIAVEKLALGSQCVGQLGHFLEKRPNENYLEL
jgi:hypothetical protein